MTECPKCQQVDSIMKAGFVRGNQRFLCKNCDYYFTIPSANRQVRKRRRHQTTIIDIAQDLGVSNSTVSRALHGHPDINPNTRRAILEKAQELDYQPNQLAHSLVKSRTETVGIIVPEFMTQFFPNIIVGAQKVLAQAGYHLIIMQSDESYETEKNNTKALLANRVDGLLVSMSHETNNYDHLRIFEKRDIPVVYFNRVSEELGKYRVVVNDYQGAYTAVDHLIRNGYRRIAHLGGPTNLLISQERLRGYCDALRKNGLEVIPELVIHGDLRAQKARIYTGYFLDLPVPPDAIFAVNDPSAIEIMMLAKAKGLRIPDDLGVVGFSDDSIAAHIGNGLTTVKQPTTQIGEAAARMILRLIQGEEELAKPETVVLEAELIVRGSSVRVPLTPRKF
ncbi:LacI family DNA-binding transcriptional regulator [Salmonirosea aquatica]|uniref:Substrate-binding domain-containing protein n=1 Tax=Salmonirosea aquatica TaxID=2654236 RepID=A0A7C9FRA6_9BACT|nr:substrate-binding domain-containing protein [Cytophagaceae bacterium SJW1-29]